MDISCQYFYYVDMDIENLDNVQLMKMLIYGEGATQKEISEKLGMTPTNFSQVMRRNNLRIADLQKVCKLLGYKITIEKK